MAICEPIRLIMAPHSERVYSDFDPLRKCVDLFFIKGALSVCE